MTAQEQVEVRRVMETLDYLLWGCEKEIILFFLFLIFIEVLLIYSVVLISGVEQSGSVTHIYIFFQILFPL